MLSFFQIKPLMHRLRQKKKIPDLVIRRFASFYPECEKDHTEIITSFAQHTTKGQVQLFKN